MPDAQTINIEVTIPPYPEGSKKDPSEYAQWLVENMRFQASGAFLSGQIGGAAPTSNIGLFINGGKVQYWDGAKYASTLSVPIGAMFPWPGSNLAVPDEDYLFCDGSLILKADYPLLSVALGLTWGATGDDAAYFRLPSTAGRVMVGAGTGDYNPTKSASIPSGNMTAHSTGDYYGFEWPTYRQTTPANPAVPRYYYAPYGGTHFNARFFTGISQPSFVSRWIIRAK